MEKQRIIEIAEEADLVFNQDSLANPNQKAYKWHKERLYQFANLLEQELQTNKE